MNIIKLWTFSSVLAQKYATKQNLKKQWYYAFMWPWTTKLVISSKCIFVAISNNTICVKTLTFLRTQKSISKNVPLWVVLWSTVPYFSVKVKKKWNKPIKYINIIRLFKLYQSCVYWSLIGEALVSTPPHPRPVQTHLALNWWGGGAGWTMEDCQRRQQGTAWASPHWQPRPQRLNCFAGTN